MPNDLVKVLKTQDAGYIRTQRAIEESVRPVPSSSLEAFLTSTIPPARRTPPAAAPLSHRLPRSSSRRPQLGRRLGLVRRSRPLRPTPQAHPLLLLPLHRSVPPPLPHSNPNPSRSPLLRPPLPPPQTHPYSPYRLLLQARQTSSQNRSSRSRRPRSRGRSPHRRSSRTSPLSLALRLANPLTGTPDFARARTRAEKDEARGAESGVEGVGSAEVVDGQRGETEFGREEGAEEGGE